MGDALEALRIVAILVQPAMPDTAQAVWERIGMTGQRRRSTPPRRGGLGSVRRWRRRHQG